VEAEFEATQNTETPLEFLVKSIRDTAAEPADCSSRQGGGAILIRSCRHWLTDFVTGTATIGRFRISSASLKDRRGADTIAIFRYRAIPPLSEGFHPRRCESGP
jgi:hypothetical protein